MPMRTECKHFESRTYANGDSVRSCSLDLAPEAPWRCPDECPRYERRLADRAWSHGTLTPGVTPENVPGLDDGSAAAVLDEAEAIVNAIGFDIIAEFQKDEAGKKRRWWRRRKDRE